MHAEFDEDVLQISEHRVLAEKHLGGDLAIREPGGREAKRSASRCGEPDAGRRRSTFAVPAVLLPSLDIRRRSSSAMFPPATEQDRASIRSSAACPLSTKPAAPASIARWVTSRRGRVGHDDDAYVRAERLQGSVW